MTRIVERAAVHILRDMSFGYSKKESEDLVKTFPVATMSAQERETLREFAGRAMSVSRGAAARSILRAYRKDLREAPSTGLATASKLVQDEILGVLDGSVEAYGLSYRNPAVDLFSDHHTADDVDALRAKIVPRNIGQPSNSSDIVERFYDLEMIEPEDQGSHYVAVEVKIGEAGDFDFGNRLAIVDTKELEIYWCDDGLY